MNQRTVQLLILENMLWAVVFLAVAVYADGWWKLMALVVPMMINVVRSDHIRDAHRSASTPEGGKD